MPYWVYILKSETTGKLYIDQTSDLEKRLMRHNSEEMGATRFTHRQRGPRLLIYSEELKTRSEAMKGEKFLKSGRGREWIKDNILDK